MSGSDQRITLAQAVDHLVSAGRTLADAERELLDGLQAGSLQALAKKTRTQYPGSEKVITRKGIIIEPNEWVDAKINRTRESAMVRYDDYEETEHDFFYSAHFQAEGLTLFRSQIEKIGSQIASSNPRRGGRPLKHDWAGAAGYLAGYVVEQDWQPAADLVRALEGWFKRHGKTVDRRDVERFVAEMMTAKTSKAKP